MDWNPIAMEPLESRKLLTVNFTVSFADNGAFTIYHDEIQRTILAAGAEWASKLLGGGTIDVQVSFSGSIATAQTASLVSVPVGTSPDGFELDAQGAGYEIQTETDPNGTDPDVQIDIGTSYLQNDLWFDPDPTTRTATVPADKVDAYSVLLHELAHGFAFNGERSQSTGSLTGDAESTFDQYIRTDGSHLYFDGPNARAAYGGAVPLTAGNIFHVANNAPLPGSDLLGDLMNGVQFNRGARYGISNVDLGILQDSGVAVVDMAPLASITAVSQYEGGGGKTPFVFNVSLSAPATSDVTVKYETADGSATAGSDYIATSGVLTIPAGQTSGTVRVDVLGDIAVETDETFTVTLSDPNGAQLGDSVATSVILNDDLQPAKTLSFSPGHPVSYADADGRTVTVKLSGIGTGTITFNDTGMQDAEAIILTGTDKKSSLSIKSNGAVALHNLLADSTLGSITGTTTTVTGSLAAPVRSHVTLAGLNGAVVDMGTAGSVSLNAGSVMNSTIGAGSMNSIKSTGWSRSNLAVGSLTSFGAGTVINSTFRADTNIGKFSAVSVDGSSIMAGVQAGLVGLPDLSTQFTSIAAIKSVSIKKNFSNTLIAAAHLGSMSLGVIQLSNALNTFGVACESYTSLHGTGTRTVSGVTTTTKIRLSRSHTFMGSSDFKVWLLS